MAEAVVDLPDPTSPPPPVENADELLAQLAGEQIDRLLSEAEAPLEPTPIAPTPEPEPAPVAVPIPELAPPPPVAEPLAAPAVAEAESAPGLLIRLLEFINAPFAACPPWLRDLLGKLAILLGINGVAGILYAVLIKHR